MDNPGSGTTPVFNRTKAGNAIPVKFSLGGDQGLNIFAAGYPKVETVTCDTGSVDDIESPTTDSTSGLKYDPATGQYTYVWKTDSTWANSCRKLTVRLLDGTDHVAYFTFTK